MARKTVEEARCDFCGYGGPLSMPEDFTRDLQEHDLCRWCVVSNQPMAWSECGGHRTTFSEDMSDWTCSCGETFRSVMGERHARRLALFFPSVGIPQRLASLHGEGYTFSFEGAMRWHGGA